MVIAGCFGDLGLRRSVGMWRRQGNPAGRGTVVRHGAADRRKVPGRDRRETNRLHSVSELTVTRFAQRGAVPIRFRRRLSRRGLVPQAVAFRRFLSIEERWRAASKPDGSGDKGCSTWVKGGRPTEGAGRPGCAGRRPFVSERSLREGSAPADRRFGASISATRPLYRFATDCRCFSLPRASLRWSCWGYIPLRSRAAIRAALRRRQPGPRSRDR